MVLVMHTTSYNVAAFVRGCENAGLKAVIASDRCHMLDGVWRWPSDSLLIDFYDPPGAAAAIAARLEGLPPVRAVVPVGGEVAVHVATLAARRLALSGNDPAAAEAAASKLRMRELCAAAAVHDGALRVPAFQVFPFDSAADQVAAVVSRNIGWPCVVKPLLLSGSRGVIRADDAPSLASALARVHRLLSAPELLKMGGDSAASRQILIETFVSGAEVALEGLLTDGTLRTLALFDKPDPLEGPFFEETLYVTPSRHPPAAQAAVERAVQSAARALGLWTGPLHAEVRLGPDGPVVIEVAARSIGGLCSRTLRFGTGFSLEDLIIRHAVDGLGENDPSDQVTREQSPAGVMMIPIPRAGVLKEVRGAAAAGAVPGIEEIVISVGVGATLTPLPEGASYLGFIFARGGSPEAVESSLRAAHAQLRFEITPLLSVF